MVQAFIHCRLDYCNALLAGITDTQIKRLQAVQHTPARLMYGARRRNHITPVLHSLHWLPVRRRIIFNTAVLVWKCIHGVAAPAECRWRKFKDVLDCGRHRLDVSTCHVGEPAQPRLPRTHVEQSAISTELCEGVLMGVVQVAERARVAIYNRASESYLRFICMYPYFRLDTAAQ